MSFPPPICNHWLRCNLAALSRRSGRAPGSPAVAGSPPSQGSRRSPCFYSSPLDAARSKDGAGPRRLMLGTLAACLRFRRPRGRGRRSALLNVGPRLAARRRLPPSRRLTPPGSFRPSSRLRFRGRARRGRGCGLTGSTHRKTCRRWRQQPAKRRAQAVRSGRPDSLLSAPLRGLAAVAFSNVWISGPSFFQCLDTLIE